MGVTCQRPVSLRRRNIWFEEEDWAELKKHAIERGLSPSELVGEVLSEHLSDTATTRG